MARAQAPGLRVPFLLAPAHRRSQFLLHRRLRRFGAADPGAFMRELEQDGLRAHLDHVEAEHRASLPAFDPGSVMAAEGALLYGLVRALRPRTVVETGTASGISTAYLLAALERNEAGRLLSIDLPFEGGELQPLVAGTSIDLYDASPLPPGKAPGWAIPTELRARWDLRLGDARDVLPALLVEVGEIELFFHDSLHTREHMLFEFETVWPALARGGVLASDDVFQRKHDALPSFAQSVGRTFATFGNLGFVRK
jgi:predicted O-methyltransferase YrrM